MACIYPRPSTLSTVARVFLTGPKLAVAGRAGPARGVLAVGRGAGSGATQRRWAHGVRKKRGASFPVLNGEVDQNSTDFVENRDRQRDIHTNYELLLKSAMAGGGEKSTARHVQQNRKLLAEDRLRLMLDEDGEWLELSTLAGMGMEYGSIPRAGIITGIGQVQGRYCAFLINDATIKGGTIFPVAVKKQLRAQEIAMTNHLPCIYIVDSGGAFLPLQADIFPDREHGGRAFYNEAILNSMNIPQVAVVCGSCTAGGAYVPTMCQEAVMVDRVGTIFLGGPPLVYAALGEVVSAEDLGGATLHCSVSGAADHFADNEEEAFTLSRNIVETFNIPELSLPEDYDEPLHDEEELSGLIPASRQETMDMHKVLSRIVDGSCFQEFKACYGPTLITGFAHIQGNLVGIVANNGSIDGPAATKGSHFVQLCSQRHVPLVFLQNTPPPSLSNGAGPLQADAVGIELRMHARLLAAVACTQVPKLTVIVGNSFGASNYMMGGRSFDPRFVFSWPNAKIGIDAPDELIDTALKAKSAVKAGTNDEDVKKLRESVTQMVHQQTSAIYSSSRIWDDGIILPQETRQVLGRCLRIVNQSQTYQEHSSPVMRM